MKLLILFLSALIFLACQTAQLGSKKQTDEETFKQMVAEQEAVKKRVEQDQKSDEQIFEEMLAEERANPEISDENVETFQCCAHWMADGTCAHELVPGCSQELDADNGAQNLFFEVKAPNSCCASWAADGSCYHEIIPGCSQK